MRSAAAALVAALGFFALVAQTLLFREWLGALEGTELAIGSFFAAWLLWVGLGALAARLVRTRRLAAASLLYLPAFVLQHVLILDARPLAGVPVYEILGLDTLALLSLLANAPVSFATGFLFTTACRAAPEEAGLPVARVYALESAGAFLGGVVVTVLLALRVDAVAVACLAGLLLAAASWAAGRGRAVRTAAALACLVLLLAPVTGLAHGVAEARNRLEWSRLLPEASYEESFATAQARYLVGRRAGTVIVLSRGVTEDVAPDAEHAGEVAALTLAQAPHARRVALVGPGALSLAVGLSTLEGIERLAWLHPDPDYPSALTKRLPPDLRAALAKVEIPAEDGRAFLAREPGAWDLVILDLPDVTTLVSNRYATQELFAIVRRALAAGGVAALRVTGGENVMGEEVTRLGASSLATLESVFAHVVVKPGEESWLLASDGDGLTQETAVLRDRWASIAGAAALFPPEAVPGLYLPDRVAFETEAWRDAIARWGDAVLLNTDARPKALLHGLALRARRAGRSSPDVDLDTLLGTGVPVLAAWILVYAVLRSWALRSGRRANGTRPFDAWVLVFTTGLAGMSVGVVLMVAYQARFGSLYLDVGLLSSLFMLGLAAGAALLGRALAPRNAEPAPLLPALLGTWLLVLAAAAFLPPVLPRFALAALFLPAGAVTGAFFPLASWRLRAAGRDRAAAGAALEAADHAGGAVGAALTGLLLLPLFGALPTLALVGLLVLVNLVPRLVRARAPSPLETPTDRRLRGLGLALVGGTACVLLASVAAHAAVVGRRMDRVEGLARELAAPDVAVSTAVTGEDGFPYYVVATPEGEPRGWVFPTRDLAPEVVGYGGVLDLWVRVDAQGRLQGFRFLDSRETPAYVAMLAPWRESLRGRDLFVPDPFEGVDTVSGATITSDAVLRAVETAGRRFAHRALGLDTGAADAPTSAPVSADVFVLLGLAVLAVLLRYRPDPWLRRAWLLLVLIVAGLWLNAQYSTQQVYALLQGELPAAWLGLAAFFVVGVPVLVLLFGNVYCGWLCPFGAAQELLGDVGRRRWETDPHRDVWRWGRAVKYVLLALLLVAAAASGRREVLGADPLLTLFSGRVAGAALTLVVFALLLSLVFGRFFCRNLCPAGAFLALLNRVTLLKRFVPPPRTGRCDLGVRSHHDLDCICCDRCRHG